MPLACSFRQLAEELLCYWKSALPRLGDTSAETFFVSTFRRPERKRGTSPMFVIEQNSLHHRRPLARSRTPKAFGFGMTRAEHNVERGTSIAPRTYKKISESIDT